MAATASPLLYSSDWLTIVASLAAIARENDTACVVALGFGAPDLLMRSDSSLGIGLVWSIKSVDSRNGKTSGMLKNTHAFASALRKTCKTNGKAMYVVGVITLMSDSSSHLLSYVYAPSTRAFEVFDPNGGVQYIAAAEGAQQRRRVALDTFLFNDFATILRAYLVNQMGIADDVVMPGDWCPPIGMQIQEETQLKAEKAQPGAGAKQMKEAHHNAEFDFGGYCAAWSLWWLRVRLTSSPETPREKMLEKASRSLKEITGGNLRKWMLAYAQSLTKNTLLIMAHALKLGGRTKHDALALTRQYANAKTACQRAENAASAGVATAEDAYDTCTYMHRRIIDPILSEVQANVRTSIRVFGRGRLLMH